MCQNTILPDLNAVDYFPNTVYFQTCAVIILIRKISRKMYSHTPGKNLVYTARGHLAEIHFGLDNT